MRHNIRNRFASAGRKLVTGATLALVGTQAAFAQGGGQFDVSDATDTIAAGVVAVGLIGGAMLAVKILKKVWSKIG